MKLETVSLKVLSAMGQTKAACAEEKQTSLVYDEEYECYTCLVDLDEDEMENFMRENTAGCPFFRFDNEYKTVNKQI